MLFPIINARRSLDPEQQQIRSMPENGLICIQNAYESTQRLLTNLEMMYTKIKKYYAAVLENTKPEELLAGHLYGYVKDVVDKLIFPIKVDDSFYRPRKRHKRGSGDSSVGSLSPHPGISLCLRSRRADHWGELFPDHAIL